MPLGECVFIQGHFLHTYEGFTRTSMKNPMNIKITIKMTGSKPK